MTPQEHIENQLRKLAEPIQRQDVAAEKLEDAIYAKVTSKKFRKLKMDADAEAVTKKAIKLAVDKNEPILMNNIFGGNKLWRLDEAPEIDWAELFNAIFVAEWLKGVASVYEAGVYLEYYSMDIMLESMNNLPKSETDAYTKSFEDMLLWLKQYLPYKVDLRYRKLSDEYKSEEEYLADLEEVKQRLLKENNGSLPEMTDAQKEATELNVVLKPGQDRDAMWREKVELIHRSLDHTKKLNDYIYDPKYIPAAQIPYQGCITIGSTKKSIAKFWVGVGGLEEHGGRYREVILTPKQLDQETYEWHKISLPGLNSKNFSKIRVKTPEPKTTDQ